MNYPPLGVPAAPLPGGAPRAVSARSAVGGGGAGESAETAGSGQQTVPHQQGGSYGGHTCVIHVLCVCCMLYVCVVWVIWVLCVSEWREC